MWVVPRSADISDRAADVEAAVRRLTVSPQSRSLEGRPVETIHPYTDGNGRVGRALIHTVLTRRGLTPSAVLPVSLVLLTRSDAYLDGLTAYRYDGAPESRAAQDAVEAWLGTFLEAAALAADQVVCFTSDLAELRAQWSARLSARRAARGVREVPRADSAVARLAEVLPGAW